MLSTNKCNIEARVGGGIIPPPISHAGFTLLELLVSVVILGILSAIALPNMLSGVAKSKQSEAKLHIGSINKAQLAYRLESGKFAPDLDSLNISLPPKTKNYSYTFEVKGETAVVLGEALDKALKGYSGGSVQYVDKTGNSATATVICENKVAGSTAPAAPVLQPQADNPEDAASCNESQVKL